jgi:hypothetical protein
MAEKQPHTQSSRLEVGEDRREPLMFQRTADRDGDGDGDEQAGCRQSSFHVVDRVG